MEREEVGPAAGPAGARENHRFGSELVNRQSEVWGGSKFRLSVDGLEELVETLDGGPGP